MDVKIYSTYNDGKLVVAERFIKTLKSKTYKDTPSLSKNAYTDKFDEIKNTTMHITELLKWNLLEAHINFSKTINYKNAKFKFVDYMSVLKSKNIFAKVFAQIWSG